MQVALLERPTAATSGELSESELVDFDVMESHFQLRVIALHQGRSSSDVGKMRVNDLSDRFACNSLSEVLITTTKPKYVHFVSR